MKLILRDRNQGMADAWNKVFYDVPDVEIGCGDIFDVAADAIVSPSNSFGFMNGGIDAAYTKRFGQQLEDRLREYIALWNYGEILVGEAITLNIGVQDQYKYLISAPTMRVPMDISGTINAYLAMRAVLLEIQNSNKDYDGEPINTINSVLCPGLGTAIGRLPYDVAAHQMREAYRTVMEKPYIPDNIAAAWRYNEQMRRGLPYNGDNF